jgi:alpha-L-arabinofuranosidase
MERKFLYLIFFAFLHFPASAQTETRQLSIDTKTLGIEISPTLSGIFFEDINQSLDGGICAQMIQNNSFQAYNVPDGPANEFSQSDTIFFGWTVVSKGGAVGTARAVSDHPLVKLERKYDYDPNDKYDDELRYMQYCVRFDIEKAGAGFGIAANGYGIAPSTRDRGAIYSNNTQRPSLAVEAGVNYDLGLYLQGEKYKGKVSVWLEDIDGRVNSNVITLSKLKDAWKKYTGRLKAQRTKDSRLVIAGDKAGTFFLDFVTLLPEASKLWNNGKNGPLRKDLMEALAALHPKFMRFPGGCASEGPNYFGQVFWKNSVGKPEERLGFRNHWGYWTSQYVGFYEYLLMAESLGATPLPVLNNGVTCQFVRHSYIAPLETEADRKRFHDIFVCDALDFIEFCNGSTTTKWGKLRAEMGHPAPFNLKYLGIGNENQGPEFWERFDIIYKEVQAKYPDIIIISTAGSAADGREFNANMHEIDAKYQNTVVDEHYYRNNQWFYSNGERYNADKVRGADGLTYDRSRPTRVFVGEFANNSSNNDYASAMAEAAYWLSLERNSDMVVMAAYAPLFCKKGYNKWNSNLIWFDNRGLWRTTNYYYQQLFSLGGNRALKCEDVKNGTEADTKIYTSPTIDTKTGTIYLKFVNAEAKDKQITVSLNNADAYTAEMEYMTSHDTSVKNQGDQNYYSSHPNVPADFSYREAIIPQTKSLGTVKSSFTFTMPENSVGVLRLKK